MSGLDIEGLIIFLVLATTCSLLSHILIKRISVAILLAAISTAIIFQFLVYFLAGYLDPFFPFSLLTTFAIAFLIVLVIGVPFKVWRRSGNENKNSAI